jgi:hypothetical protein
VQEPYNLLELCYAVLRELVFACVSIASAHIHSAYDHTCLANRLRQRPHRFQYVGYACSFRMAAGTRL